MAQGRTDPHLNKLRRLHQDRKKEIQKEIQDFMVQHRNEQHLFWHESVTDVEDLSFRNHTGEDQISILGGKNRLPLQVDVVLQGLDEGMYGFCEDCNQPIRPERLRVQPFVGHCVDCQEKAELIESSRSTPVRPLFRTLWVFSLDETRQWSGMNHLPYMSFSFHICHRHSVGLNR